MPGFMDTIRALQNRGQFIDQQSGFGAPQQQAPVQQAPVQQAPVAPQTQGLRNFDAINAATRRKQQEQEALRTARPQRTLEDVNAQIAALEAQQAQAAKQDPNIRQFGAGRQL